MRIAAVTVAVAGAVLGVMGTTIIGYDIYKEGI